MLSAQFEQFLIEASRLKEDYAKKITLLVGLETEYITDVDLEALEEVIHNKGHIEYLVGSVHHVNSIPIDFDEATFQKCLDSFAVEDIHEQMETFLCAYFDAHYQILTRFHPEVVGHLDLCRLYRPSLRFADYPSAWQRLERNVRYAIGYGALFELNAAALRKGWSAAYPGQDAAKLILESGGRFALSDDSHGPHAVGLNYNKLFEYARKIGVEELWYLKRSEIPNTAAYLRTLPAIRERCGRVYTLARQGKLDYFTYDPEKEANAAEFCVDIIKRDFGSDFASIPPHGRWRHLDAGRPRVEPLIAQWKIAANPPSQKEITKRLIDLFLVSVLLDAGAGNTWTYHEKQSDMKFTRSEGLGVASINMFEDGFFSSDRSNPHRVDAAGLSCISQEMTAAAMQVNDSNPMVGIDGRTSLLIHLSKALEEKPAYFGSDARPGNLIDFLESESIAEGSTRRVHIFCLWTVLIEGLASIWPATRTTLGGVLLGDVWPCNALKSSAVAEGDELVPFHKLTGWITYSLIEPIQKVLGWEFEGLEHMTGLPEYRNGGLLVDLGVLTLRDGALPANFYPHSDSPIPRLPPSHPAIVEWRAMTVIELDRIAAAIRQKLGLTAEQLSLAQVLESATWKAGREIAKERRPATGGPPIDIESDGTVF
ncbi:uncharacterized protein FIBRA_02390 [Fibroporia radiculosa]|uniref:histidinol-phosphatase n=1 Tax=Fibroporia radiculosa TaxID=599839 RepID=J4GMU8_9APHY|nr:uncharacterized protein FIBRA_02390 [Fibroporia radiculosa]CCM00360.1 predicted protein [Fibroporia radiculosa]